MTIYSTSQYKTCDVTLIFSSSRLVLKADKALNVHTVCNIHLLLNPYPFNRTVVHTYAHKTISNHACFLCIHMFIVYEITIINMIKINI